MQRMDLNFFADPGLAPKPRSEIRIEKLEVSAYPDGRRIRVELELTPFAPKDRPNIELTALRSDGAPVGSTTIIEAVQRAIGLTLHLREPEQPQGEYRFVAQLYYDEEPIQHELVQTLIITGSEDDQALEN
jgi:hypothetical protein